MSFNNIHFVTAIFPNRNVKQEKDAQGILQSVYDAGVSTGEFVKAILKIYL